MAGRTFYVDANGGSDSNDGASPASAWQTIGHVNSQSFQPGDRILFQRGDTFAGTLDPSSSGASGSLIEFGAYGTGANPVLRGDGSSEVVDISGVNYIRMTGIDVTNGKRGVLLENTTGSEVIDCHVYENSRDGIYIGRDAHDNLVQGGSSSNNGEEDAKYSSNQGRMINLGHGVLINTGAHHNTVEGVELNANAEDGVQFGPSAGDGNVLRDNQMLDNLEDGVDIKCGSHELIGNTMHGNVVNALNLHNDTGIITLTGNDLRTVTVGNALDVREGARVISNGNRYEGANNNAVDLTDGAGDNSSFTNDLFVDGGSNTGASVRVGAGQGHSFQDSVFVMTHDGVPLELGDGAGDVSVSGSSFYTDGEAMDTNGANVESSGNVFGTAAQAANAIAETMATLFGADGLVATSPARPQDESSAGSGGDTGTAAGGAEGASVSGVEASTPGNGGQPDLTDVINRKLFGGIGIGADDQPSGAASPAPTPAAASPAPAAIEPPADASPFDISLKLGGADLLHAGDYMFGA